MDKKIYIKLCEKDMDAIEDAFFIETTPKQYKEIHARLRKVWVRLCTAMEETPSEPETNTIINYGVDYPKQEEIDKAVKELPVTICPLNTQQDKSNMPKTLEPAGIQEGCGELIRNCHDDGDRYYDEYCGGVAGYYCRECTDNHGEMSK